MSNVRSLSTGKAPDIREAPDIVDRLRADIEAGRVVRFAAVGIASDEACELYAASSGPVTESRLQMLGAIARLHHHYLGGGV